MKRYLIFAFDEYDMVHGGWGDFQESSDNFQTAKKRLHQIMEENNNDKYRSHHYYYGQIIDLEIECETYVYIPPRNGDPERIYENLEGLE